MTLKALQRSPRPSAGANSAMLSSSSASSSQPLQRAALLVLAGATAASVLPALWRRLRQPVAAAAAGAANASRSTTSSAGGGVAAYESRKAVDEYLQFHFGKPEEVMPYDCGPKVRPGRKAGRQGRLSSGGAARMYCAVEACLAFVLTWKLCAAQMSAQDALRFTDEIAVLCERHCPALLDFTGAPPPDTLFRQPHVAYSLTS
jgi:hypothetical protein